MTMITENIKKGKNILSDKCFTVFKPKYLAILAISFTISTTSEGKDANSKARADNDKTEFHSEFNKAGSPKFSFSLYSTKTGKPIAGYNPIADGAVIDLSKVGKDIKIVFNSGNSKGIKSVLLGYNDTRNYQLEDAAPFAVRLKYDTDSEDENNFNSWTPVMGDNIITAKLFEKEKAKGEAFAQASISFKIVEENRNINGIVPIENSIVFPNPSDYNFNIVVQDNASATYKIFNQAGVLVGDGNINEYQTKNIDVKDFPEGMYYLQTTTINGTTTKRLIIKH